MTSRDSADHCLYPMIIWSLGACLVILYLTFKSFSEGVCGTPSIYYCSSCLHVRRTVTVKYHQLPVALCRVAWGKYFKSKSKRSVVSHQVRPVQHTLGPGGSLPPEEIQLDLKKELFQSLIINTTAKANDTTDILQTFQSPIINLGEKASFGRMHSMFKGIRSTQEVESEKEKQGSSRTSSFNSQSFDC